MALIEIDCHRLVYFLLKHKSGLEQQKAYVEYCVKQIGDLCETDKKKAGDDDDEAFA
jgi:hypothetical protein